MRVRKLSPFAALLVAMSGCAGPPDVAPRPVAASRQQPGAVVESALPSAQRRVLDRALDRYLRGRPGRAALAVYDRTTGARYAFRERTPFMLASVAKVDILLAFLMGKWGERLSDYERDLASRMIRESDNDCAHELYMTIGGRDGLARALRRLDVRHTRPGGGLSWGSTHSRPSDQVKVLEQLTDPKGPLPARNRRYALRLMSSVTPSQAWGVSAAASGGEVALKNGWLPAQVHGGLWTVNSVGRLAVRGHELLVAVLSERSPDMASGVATVERLARLAVGALMKPAGTAGTLAKAGQSRRDHRR
ncbi:Beta-lactamase class A [Nonomuraea solani]|uniref:Beta-lactamase class A n=1 Tax=Nonomuraea solani TaxID=1144553 RepID=A0A1H6DPK4_9ACTN|nr:serine hydrolase [Nonomuraea solani]SEG87210.1 Beta-lactamase class A [Nonomuraea solani]